MAKYKIKVTDECIGCRACISEAEENFKFNEETNKAEVKKEEISEKELQLNKNAEEVCPVEAIKIEEV